MFVNFSVDNTYDFELQLPENVIKSLNLNEGVYQLEDQLYDTYTTSLHVLKNKATVQIHLKPLESLVLKIKN